jgi:hypothetical protein
MGEGGGFVERREQFLAEEFLNFLRWLGLMPGLRRRELFAAAESMPAEAVRAKAIRVEVVTREQADALVKIQESAGPAPDEDAFRDLVLRGKLASRHDVEECLRLQKAEGESGKTPFLVSLLVFRGDITLAEAGRLLNVQAEEGKGLLPVLYRKTGVRPPRDAVHVWNWRSPWGWAAAALLVFGGVLLARFFAGGGGPSPIMRICGKPGCESLVRWRPAAGRLACPKCGHDRMVSAIYCTGCSAWFPCRTYKTKEGQMAIKPCPKCGSPDADPKGADAP